MSQSPKPLMCSQIPNVPLLLPKSGTPNLPTFRSWNNNMIWIHNDNNNKTPVSAQKPCSFTIPDYQWKASRDLTQLDPPENHSINLSFTTQPPDHHPLTSQETKIMEDLDPLVFNPISIIDIQRFSQYTSNHPNRVLISYLTNGLKFGFRLGYTGDWRMNIMDNLFSLDLSLDTLPTFIRNEIKLGYISGPFSL